MNIVFVGQTGVPFLNRASDTRLLYFANALSKKNKVFILNRLPFLCKSKTSEALLDEKVEVINLFNEKKTNAFLSVIYYLISYPIEFFFLLKLNKKQKIDAIHLYSWHFHNHLFYFIIAKIISAKVCKQYVEYSSEVKRQGVIAVYHKINGYFVDFHGHRFVDGILPISNYIENHVRILSPKMPMLKVPPICDFDYFDTIKSEEANRNPYLLYCGSISYIDVISTIIDSFTKYKQIYKDLNLSLFLVITGDLNVLKPLVQHDEKILIFHHLDYDHLIQLYKNAEILLIPLRNTTQDVARFPNKICEYTASKGLILTTNVGEVPFYFENQKNALIIDDFTVDSIIEQINYAFQNKDKLKNIKEAAYISGRENFDIYSYINKLDMFFRKICNLFS